MQVAQSNRTLTAGRTKPFQHNAHNDRAAGKSSEKKAQQCAFLMTKFEDIPIFDLAPAMIDCLSVEDGERLILGNVKVDILTNMARLRQCAEAYCRVHGGHLPPRCENPLKELQTLYHAVSNCCPDKGEIEINYIGEKNELIFLELAYAPYQDYFLAFITVRFLEYLPEEYKNFFLQLLSLVRASLEIPFPENHFDFAYTCGYFDEEYIEIESVDDEEYAKMVKEYREGKVKKLFDEIFNAPWQFLDSNPPEVSEWIMDLISRAPNKELKRLVELAADGIALMSGESINRFRHNLGQCNIPEFDMIEYGDDVCAIDRICAFCYGEAEDDPIVERTIDLINGDAGNFMQEELYEAKVITPEYSEPFRCSGFPDKWFEWYKDFQNAISDYEQTVKDDVGGVQAEDGNHRI